MDRAKYYAYEMERRRSLLYAARIQHLAWAQQTIANLQNAIHVGVDIRTDPVLRPLYLRIQQEFGDGVFVFEDSKNSLITKEENKAK